VDLMFTKVASSPLQSVWVWTRLFVLFQKPMMVCFIRNFIDFINKCAFFLDLDEVEIEFKLVRGNNLAKKYPLHTPDPFAEIIINDECYWTTIQKRTFNPTWNFEINL
jgi:hypothetical protein